MGNYFSMVARFGNRCAEKEGGYYCHFCAKKVQRRFRHGDIDKATIDHVVPKSKGGEDTLDNLVLCCHQCNTEKADTPYMDFWKSKQDIRLRNTANREHSRKGKNGGKLTGNRTEGR